MASYAPRCGFEGVLEVDRARRISPMELRCFSPSRTVGFGRVFLMHEDAFGELTVRHQGMLELEAWIAMAMDCNGWQWIAMDGSALECV